MTTGPNKGQFRRPGEHPSREGEPQEFATLPLPVVKQMAASLTEREQHDLWAAAQEIARRIVDQAPSLAAARSAIALAMAEVHVHSPRMQSDPGVAATLRRLLELALDDALAARAQHPQHWVMPDVRSREGVDEIADAISRAMDNPATAPAPVVRQAALLLLAVPAAGIDLTAFRAIVREVVVRREPGGRDITEGPSRLGAVFDPKAIGFGVVTVVILGLLVWAVARHTGDAGQLLQAINYFRSGLNGLIGTSALLTLMLGRVGESRALQGRGHERWYRVTTRAITLTIWISSVVVAIVFVGSEILPPITIVVGGRHIALDLAQVRTSTIVISLIAINLPSYACSVFMNAHDLLLRYGIPNQAQIRVARTGRIGMGLCLLLIVPVFAGIAVWMTSVGAIPDFETLSISALFDAIYTTTSSLTCLGVMKYYYIPLVDRPHLMWYRSIIWIVLVPALATIAGVPLTDAAWAGHLMGYGTALTVVFGLGGLMAIYSGFVSVVAMSLRYQLVSLK